jgi:hypothetical protein
MSKKKKDKHMIAKCHISGARPGMGTLTFAGMFRDRL